MVLGEDPKGLNLEGFCYTFLPIWGYTAGMFRHIHVLLIVAFAALWIPLSLSAEDKKETTNEKATKKVPTKADIAALVKQLGAKDYKTRQKADAAIRALPAPAVEELSAQLKKSKDPEVKVRLKEIVERMTTPRITIAELKAIIIPEIEFRQANVMDCFKFLEDVTQVPTSKEDPTPRKRLKIKMKPRGAGVGVVTFMAQHITVHEALEIIASVVELKFELEDGVIVMTPKNNAGQGDNGAFPRDPFALDPFAPF
jgi:hypothetical protein